MLSFASNATSISAFDPRALLLGWADRPEIFWRWMRRRCPCSSFATMAFPLHSFLARPLNIICVWTRERCSSFVMKPVHLYSSLADSLRVFWIWMRESYSSCFVGTSFPLHSSLENWEVQSRRSSQHSVFWGLRAPYCRHPDAFWWRLRAGLNILSKYRSKNSGFKRDGIELGWHEGLGDHSTAPLMPALRDLVYVQDGKLIMYELGLRV